MDLTRGNLFNGIAEHLPEEIFEPLLETGHFRLERIVSQGQSTPRGKWLAQERSEWVVLLSGSATLSFEGGAAPINMTPGDYAHIPPQCKHRVEGTDRQLKTVWLALHY